MLRFTLHYFVLFSVMAAVWPYFPAFLRSLGFSETEVGLLQGTRMLAGALGPLVVVWLSDRIGRRRLLLSGCLLAFVLLVVPFGTTSSFWVAALLSALAGLALRTTIPLSDTLAATELADPAHQYGKVRIGGSFGFITALFAIRLLGLVDEHSAASMMRAMLVTGALALAVAQLLPERRAVRHREHAKAGGDGFGAAFWIFLSAAALQQLGMSAYYAFFTIYLQDELGMKQAAWVWALGSMAEIPVLFWAGRLTRRFRLTSLLMASMVAVTVRHSIYALLPFMWAVLPAQLLHALTFGVFHATCIEYIRRHAPEGRRAMAMGLYMSVATALPLLIGSSLGGMVIERYGYSVLFGTYALCPLLGIALIALTTRHHRARENVGS